MFQTILQQHAKVYYARRNIVQNILDSYVSHIHVSEIISPALEINCHT